MTKMPLCLLVLALLSGGCATRSPLREPLVTDVPVESAVFRQTMGSLIGPAWVEGNTIRTLNNGDEIFPAMLQGIRSAKRSVTFETFIYEDGDVPDVFAAALMERARAGVPVKVILDAVGASKSLGYHQELRDAGVDLVVYHSPWWLDVRRNNHRTHRKLLVVDGKVGFIGGVGIADYWKGNASKPEEWRELHYRVEGPVVAQMQAAFVDNWLHSRRELLLGEAYFPALKSAGSVTASVFHSSPLRNRASLELMNQLAVASARRSVCIESPYFLPDGNMVKVLCAAAERGVRVRILMPGEHMDQKAVERQSRKSWRRLMAAGVELFKYDPTMIHNKLLIVDDLFVSVGSGNLDPRSVRINDEANMNVLDRGFAREQTRVFERDLRKAHRVRLDGREIVDVPLQIAESPMEQQL